MTAINAAADRGFVHPAVFYDDDEQYLDTLVPFVFDGLACGDPVAVAVPEAKLSLLRAALGGSARQVELIDMNRAGRNPGRIIPTVLRRFADAHPDAHVRIVGEPVWPGRSEAEYPACAQHEALINAAFAGRPVTILCPYDTSGLDDTALDDARATHPLIWEGGRRYPSDRYAPQEVVERYNRPLPQGPDAREFTAISAADLWHLREWATGYARGLGMTRERLADLELIVTELATNSLCHGAGPCRVRMWTDGHHLTCEVHDRGRLLDPLAGRKPPVPGKPGGRGLLLVHQLADLVRTYTTSQGTTQYALLAWPPSRVQRPMP